MAFVLSFPLPKTHSPRSPGVLAILVWLPREERFGQKPMFSPIYSIVVSDTQWSNNKLMKERREEEGKEEERRERNAKK